MIGFSFSKKKEDKRILLTDFIFLHISKIKKSKTYKRSYRNVAKHISNFQKKTGIVLYSDNMTEQVSEEFLSYLQSDDARIKGKQKFGLMANTVNSLWQKVCHILRKARDAGYNVNLGYTNVETHEEEVNAIALSIEELQRINELKNLSPEAMAVRDRFLLGCYTALRYSDYSKLTSENIIGNTITLKTRKTGVRVVIPVHPIIRDILNRNNGGFPKLPTQQAFGATIKRVCKKAGINNYEMYERTFGTNVVRKRVKKYTLISSHTARRTGATNMYLAGIQTFRIMLITGHKTEEAFFKYIRIEKHENAKTLAEHSFFQ